MSDDAQNEVQKVMDFVTALREQHLAHSEKSTLAAAVEFDELMRPLVTARMEQIQREQMANQPTQGQMLMELVLEIEQVVSLVPPRLRRYRELLAAEGLDKTVVVHSRVGASDDAEGGREGLPGINLADQASLEFHSQLLHLALAIAQDEVQQRLQRQSQEGGL